MTGIMVAAAIGGGAGGGGGVALSAVIGAGESASDWSNDAWTFNANTVAASGGTAPYTRLWSFTSSSGGSWAFSGGATGVSAVPVVTGVTNTATATLICTVTDAAATVIASNAEVYNYENIFL